MILGDSNEWQIEPKWDGIRAQIIIRKGAMSDLVSRGAITQ